MADLKSKLEQLSLVFELANDKEPRDVVIICRQVLEKAIEIIFEVQNERKPIDATLIELINNEVVRNFFDNDIVIDQLHFIRILGINAHHDKHIKRSQAKVSYDNTKELIDTLYKKLLNEEVVLETPKFINSDNTIKYTDLSEAETRQQYIDLYLNEAGWDVLTPSSYTVISGKKIKSGTPVAAKACCEICVHGLNNASGIGFCDYVLYAKDGKPLAIIEAKKTSVDASKGQQQVREYGECMKKQYGYTPILYYTNGYERYVIDGKYPPRKVDGFHTIDELEYLIQRRDITKIKDTKVREDIAGRPYQKIAIQNICARFNDMYRRGLLVMATGTGKTRMAIALVEILTRNNWVKNVLFLADRTSLVRQAFLSFQRLLPDMTYCVLSDRKLANDDNARICFSTHQTMIRFIEDEDSRLSIGRFDLIIIDEAHRSIFNKYGSIFNYFDSLLIGLTATPKDEVDANTYSLFNCESGIPNYSYSLEEAVNDKYLVPYKVLSKTSNLLENGIAYKDLSQENQRMIDLLSDQDYDDESMIKNDKFFRSIYNVDTCRKVLDDLMKYGLRVQNGQILGKTIIFAVNHYHAELIVDTFYKLYPKYHEYCKLVDNQVKNSDNLIEQFGSDPNFRIAVSVDMLDTGIDVPSVLNLVFFKRVNSKIKLIQMIGRGTRLCEGLIDGKDKECFYIFDYFNNFNDKLTDDIKPTMTILQKIFNIKLEMLCLLQTYQHQTSSYHKQYRQQLRQDLYETILFTKKEGKDRISVRNVMKQLDKYCDNDVWQYISDTDEKEIRSYLTPVIESNIKDNYLSLSFDYKVYQAEDIYIKENSFNNAENIIKKLKLVAQTLLSKASITDISEKIPLLVEFANDVTWANMDLRKLEYYRVNIRPLAKYLEDEVIKGVIIDTPDYTKDIEVDMPFNLDTRTYKERVIDYLIENSNNPTIIKIKNLEPLNDEDFENLEDILWAKTGTKDDYYKLTKTENLAAFIRSIVGIDQKVINDKFNTFLNENELSVEQMEFINSIINYVRQNGDIDGNELVNISPFDQIDIYEVFGNKSLLIKTVIDELHNCIQN